MKDKRAEFKSPAMLKPVLIGNLCGGGVCFAALLLLAVLLTVRDFPAAAAGALATIAAGLGAFAAGFIAAKLYKKQGMAVGATSGLLLYAVVLIASMIAGDGPFTAMTLIRLAIMALASAIGGIWGVNVRAKRKII